MEDVVPAGLGGAEATGDDFVVDTDYSVLSDFSSRKRDENARRLNNEIKGLPRSD